MKRIVVLACLLLSLAPASPAWADDGLGQVMGYGYGTDFTGLGFTPMDASVLFDSGLAGLDGLGLVSSFALGEDVAQSYGVVSDIAASSQMAVDSADIARQSQEQAEAKRQAAVRAGANADGCPTTAPAGTLRAGSESVGIYKLCADSVANAPSQAAAAAIKFALRNLGAPYACGGVGRLDSFRYDCSSFVSRAYHEGAGLPTAGDGWAPSTREMVPWDGASMASWLTPIDTSLVQPGDLATYDYGATTSRHVVMVLADGFMVHTNSCGDVAHVTAFSGFGSNFTGARRVNA